MTKVLFQKILMLPKILKFHFLIQVMLFSDEDRINNPVLYEVCIYKFYLQIYSSILNEITRIVF
jgi:hypothetical protein